ncbi:hypothetical protein D083_4082 [Dickeya solani RNS 08.23.3.1.A]|nr:hypothetical protein D083_4082 [Dickeya solani RNS 08.23.3.1.A]
MDNSGSTGVIATGKFKATVQSDNSPILIPPEIKISSHIPSRRVYFPRIHEKFMRSKNKYH